MTAHLGLDLSAYVDRRLDAGSLHAFDQHLVACQVCRHAADQERRILTSLRHGATPGVPLGLQAALLEMATTMPKPAETELARPRFVPVPTVAPAAPALHRSPRRAAALAGLAATASAAAAIGFATAVPGPTSSATVLRPQLRTSGATTISFGGSAGSSDATGDAIRAQVASIFSRSRDAEGSGR